MKKTLVLGASPNFDRISNGAVVQLAQRGFEVVAIGNKPGEIGDIPILSGKPDLKDIHTVTLYLNPTNQKDYEDYILNLSPKRIIFNPGTSNTELQRRADEHGIETIHACTLVMLSLGNY